MDDGDRAMRRGDGVWRWVWWPESRSDEFTAQREQCALSSTSLRKRAIDASPLTQGAPCRVGNRRTSGKQAAGVAPACIAMADTARLDAERIHSTSTRGVYTGGGCTSGVPLRIAADGGCDAHVQG